jgi:hypothetical protein
MKSKIHFWIRKHLEFGIIAAACGACVWQGSAQIVNLIDNNSIARIDTGNQAGMFNWSVDGRNQLFQQWFWYRVGNLNAEASIDTISPPAILTPAPNVLDTRYNNGQFSVRVQYTLGGGALGSGFSDIGEIITINNLTANPLDFHFFQYSDFDLDSAGNDVVRLGAIGPLLYTASQSDVGTLTENMDIVSGANRGEVDYFANTRTRLNDANLDNLNNNLGPLGPGDVTWAFQWDFTIAGYGSVGISKDKILQLAAIPEPSAVALFSLGLVGYALRKRRLFA